MPALVLRDGIIKVLPAAESPVIQTIYVGIDPGGSGGLALIRGRVAELFSLGNVCDRAVWEWFDGVRSAERKMFAVIEKVGGYVGEAQPGSSAFKFGRSAGFLHGCLVAAGIPYQEVTPQAWQKALGVSPRKKAKAGVGGESKSQFKRRLRQLAERLFPAERITNATADALLIAEHCRRMKEGRG